jgi:hypothetical protein
LPCAELYSKLFLLFLWPGQNKEDDSLEFCRVPVYMCSETYSEQFGAGKGYVMLYHRFLHVSQDELRN